MPTVTMTRAELERTIRELRQDPRCDNPRISGISIHNQMLARKNGYPKMLHHDTEDPFMAMNEDEENKLAEQGYYPYYKFRDFPVFMHRRNMDPRFAAKFDAATGRIQLTEDFIESREFKSQADVERAMSARSRAGEGPWMLKLSDIEPLPEPDGEDPEIMRARLEGQLAEARRIAGDDTPVTTGKKRGKKAA